MQEYLSPTKKVPDVNGAFLFKFYLYEVSHLNTEKFDSRKSFYKWAKNFFWKKRILGDPGAVRRVVWKGAMKVFKHLSRLFSGCDWLPLGLRGWKKNIKHKISPSMFFLSGERPNLDIHFDQQWWRICWFEVSGNLSFHPAAWKAFVGPRQTRQP